jgi:hypothetical protein
MSTDDEDDEDDDNVGDTEETDHGEQGGNSDDAGAASAPGFSWSQAVEDSETDPEDSDWTSDEPRFTFGSRRRKNLLQVEDSTDDTDSSSSNETQPSPARSSKQSDRAALAAPQPSKP